MTEPPQVFRVTAYFTEAEIVRFHRDLRNVYVGLIRQGRRDEAATLGHFYVAAANWLDQIAGLPSAEGVALCESKKSKPGS